MGANLSSVIYYPGYSQTQVQYYPKKHQISSITNAINAVVTTTDNHHYKVGQNVAFIIPIDYGMPQFNTLITNIISVTTTTFTTEINSTNFSPFSYPSPLPLSYSLPYAIPNAEGPQQQPFLPYGNQNGFEGAIRNREFPMTGGG